LLFAAGQIQWDGLRGSIPELLAQRRGLFVQEVIQRIDVTRLSREAAQALDARTGAPALRTRRWYRAGAGQLIAMSTSVSPEGRYTITSTLRRDTGA